MPDKPYSIFKTRNIQQLAHELAFHEAGHFVFNCLGLQNTKGFSSNEYMSIYPEKSHLENENGNMVMGFLPDFSGQTMYASIKNPEPIEYREFYRNNKQGLIAKLLALAAGYATYKVFVKNEEYSISDYIRFDEKQSLINGFKSFEVEYYHEQTDHIKNCSDFRKIGIKLKTYYGIEDFKTRLESISNILCICRQIMRQPVVFESIHEVARILLNNQCQIIKGLDIQELESKIRTKIKDVAYSKILNEYKHEI